MTILCGTDFSRHATQATRVAAQLAARLHVPLKLVHVVPDSVPLLALEAPAELGHAKIQAQLRAEADELAHWETDVETIVEPGVVDEGLVQLTRSLRAQLVVLSALGARNQRRWLTGSVAERVAQSSPVPVLVVRDPELLEHWLSGERPLRVVVGCGLDSPSRAALEWASSLRAAGPCDITVAHIATPSAEGARFGISRAPIDGLDPSLEKLLLRDLRTWAGELPGAGSTTFLVSPGWGRIDTHLSLLATDMSADLLVTGRSDRSFIARLWQGSVCRGALHGSATNVACVPVEGTVSRSTSIPTIRSVLIPTDFSPLGDRAVPSAYGLLPAGGVVHVVHVTDTDDAVSSLELEGRLRALVPPGATARGVETQVHVIADTEASVGITRAAARLGVDVICMSTHGRSGASALILGSQARDVLARAGRPVFLIPPERTT